MSLLGVRFPRRGKAIPIPTRVRNRSSFLRECCTLARAAKHPGEPSASACHVTQGGLGSVQ
jgi:hypothetical protein